MKQAILITGYKNVNSFVDIIKFFGSNFNFYIHIDKKSKLDLSCLYKFSNVFITNNYVVNWGGVNHLKAILSIADAALKSVENSFFHLITAEDFPAKPINKFLDLDTSKNYLDYFELPGARWHLESGGMDRINYYNFYDLINAKSGYKNRILSKITHIQKKFSIKREGLDVFFEKLYGGSSYWSLNRIVLQYVIDYTKNNEGFLNRFKYTLCSEEIYFQTIILNSPHSCDVTNDNLRYIDFSSGRGGYPAFLDVIDFEKIILSENLFARKIKDSSELKQLLINELSKLSEII